MAGVSCTRVNHVGTNADPKVLEKAKSHGVLPSIHNLSVVADNSVEAAEDSPLGSVWLAYGLSRSVSSGPPLWG